MAAKKKIFQLDKHLLIPKHIKLNDKEKEELFKSYQISGKELPKIIKSDPAIKSLGVKPGDVIRIDRDDITAGENKYYRSVING